MYTVCSRIFENVTGKLTFSVQHSFSAKNSKEAIIKTKRVTIAFFFFPPFFHLAFSSYAVLFLRYCDFEAYRAQKTCLLTPFHSNHCEAGF